ncbi:MAG TPA: D-2-hydroxyacid dehydrogenase [Thermoanaerobaculia bacterium]|nr:D-2-hydroxyacid dehydrogenase [Thermoanaerobaculia bacterium]
MIRVAVFAPPNFEPLARLPHDPDLQFGESVDGADAILMSPRYGATLRELWPRMTSVRWIHSLGAGVETFPFDLLRQRDIAVTNSRGIYADGLAEFVIAAMLWFAKDFPRLIRNQAARRWEPYTVERLQGATAGIIGYGEVGRAVGRRAEALGMHTLTLRRHGGTPIDDLIAASDYLVLSTALTPETRKLIDSGRIARMRPNAVLINVARGAVVDEAALVEALQQKRIRGAALDVFEIEPLPAESPLWGLDNALVSPHTADHAADSHERAMDLFLRNLAHFRRGEPLENVVDKESGY